MTAYAFLILALAVLAPLPWWGIYRLDRRCAGEVDAGHGAYKEGVAVTAASAAPADGRSPRAPDQAATALGQPGPGHSM